MHSGEDDGQRPSAEGRAGQRQLKVPRQRGPAAIELDTGGLLPAAPPAATAPAAATPAAATPDAAAPAAPGGTHPADGLHLVVVGDDDGGAAPELYAAAGLVRHLEPHAASVTALPATPPPGLMPRPMRRRATERAGLPAACDLVVAVSPEGAVAGARVARRRDARLLVVVRELTDAGALTRRERAALVDADRVAAVGETARSELRAAGVPDGRIALLPWADHPARLAAVLAETLDVP